MGRAWPRARGPRKRGRPRPPHSSWRARRLTSPRIATMTWSSTAMPTTSPTSHQPPRDAEVLLARLGVAAGVVVDQDHGRGRVQDGRLEHLARVHDGGVQAADRDHLAALHLVARVEQQHHEVLLARPRQVAHLGEHVLGPADRRAAGRALDRAAPQLEGRHQRGRARRPHPGHEQPARARPERPARPGCAAPGGARCAARCARPCPSRAPAPAARRRRARPGRARAASPGAGRRAQARERERGGRGTVRGRRGSAAGAHAAPRSGLALPRGPSPQLVPPVARLGSRAGSWIMDGAASAVVAPRTRGDRGRRTIRHRRPLA